MELDIEAIERATFEAVRPQQLVEGPGWLVGLDDGTVGRAHSAAPVRHDSIDPRSVDEVRAIFARAGRQPVFRVPQFAAFDAVRAALAAGGAKATKPTLTMVGTLDSVASMPATVPVVIREAPDEAWSAVFHGPGFDPVDGASRIAILRRGRSNRFAAALVDGEVVAVGASCAAHGWCGFHGMRTTPAFRGRGLAGAILGELAREAAGRGFSRAFLQVEQPNPAQRLYRRAGFEQVWCSEYWKRA